MPYFITEQSAECSAWATVKEDGEVMGCHGDKQGAIDQMVALSIEEDIEPGGERFIEVRAVSVPDYISSCRARLGVESRGLRRRRPRRLHDSRSPRHGCG